MEKKLEIKIKDPYTKQEIPHNETHWIKICALESGAIFGEEVLMDEYEKEGYQYRISVIFHWYFILVTHYLFVR